MSDLTSLGWGPDLEATITELHPDLRVARVSAQYRDRLQLIGDANGLAQITGRLLFDSADDELPAVGDWVIARPLEDLALVERVLPRRTVFTRAAPGKRTRRQVVAANVDTVFVVTGLDHDFNPRRIERYLVALRPSGAELVVVLNKVDLVEDLEEQRAALARLSAPVHFTSAHEPGGVEALRPYLGVGRTVALVGSSGVGKSSLINALLGEARQATAAVREDDSKGRHTTTHRSLLPIPGGGLLLDTPGMRELALWSGDDDEVFADIHALAEDCRFRDCEHEDEPGCAVQAAVEAGELDAPRLDSFHKLRRELASAVVRQDEAKRRKADRQFGRMIRSVQREHRRHKKW